MPRTKVSKTSKRNREAAHREEKLREFDADLESYLNSMDAKGQFYIQSFSEDMKNLVGRIPKALLKKNFGELMEMNLCKFSDWTQAQQQKNSNLLPTSSNSVSGGIGAGAGSLLGSQSFSSASTSLLRSTNPNDEGYLTEDSTPSGSLSGSGSVGGSASTHAAYIDMSHLRPQQQQQQQRGRTPGPLSSARARRPRLSRSASGVDYSGPGSTLKPSKSCSQADRASRSKLRTPAAAPRAKAFSADRTPKLAAYCSGGNGGAGLSPPTAFMRWPKPGELVLSTSGSPVVAQVLPEKFANVNIPVRNGVLSLRPKKLHDLKQDLIESIEPETLDQIRTLHANLDLIMNMAEKALN